MPWEREYYRLYENKKRKNFRKYIIEADGLVEHSLSSFTRKCFLLLSAVHLLQVQDEVLFELSPWYDKMLRVYGHYFKYVTSKCVWRAVSVLWKTIPHVLRSIVVHERCNDFRLTFYTALVKGGQHSFLEANSWDRYRTWRGLTI